MKVIAEVKKNTNESTSNLIRRFTRKVQETGVIREVKKRRYNQRKQSKLSRKEEALRSMAKKAEKERLFKLGKEIKTKRGRRR